MYIAGVYNPVTKHTIFRDDIRNEEVRKVLTSFPKNSYAKVYGSNIDVIVDNTVLYKTKLKVPEAGLADLYIDTTFLLDIVKEDRLVSCPWVEQNYNHIMSNISLGELVASVSNVKEEPQFAELLTLKSAQGMKFYKVPGLDKNKTYMVPMFSGFPNLAKPDKADLEIYKDAYSDSNVIVVYKINKKKLNRKIDMIFKVLDIT